MNRNRWITLGLMILLIASALGAPAAARKIVDYARDSDRVDGFHAVGARTSVEDRAKKLVATNKHGRLPDRIVRTVERADDATRLGNVPAARYVQTCRDGSLAGYAFVDAATGPEWTDVVGVAHARFLGGPPPPPGAPPDGCGTSVPRARRVGTGTYEVAPYNVSIPCSLMSETQAVLVSVRDVRPLTSTYESSCREDGIVIRVYIADSTGTLTDAAFTIGLLEPPTIYVP